MNISVNNKLVLKSILLKKILNSGYLSKLLFRFVKEIHNQLNLLNLFKCNWYELGCFPSLLIKFKYYDRYIEIFNKIVINDRNNNNENTSSSQLSLWLKNNCSISTLIIYKQLYQRSLVIAAAVCNNNDLLDFIYNAYPNTSMSELDFKKITQVSVEKGNFEYIKYIHRLFPPNRSATNIKNPFSSKTMDSLAFFGHLNVIEFLHNNRTEGCSKSAIMLASQQGFLEVVKFLHFNRAEGTTQQAMDRAAENGHLEIVKFLHYQRTEGCSHKAIDLAAENGHLEVVKFLFSNRNEGCTSEAFDMAALRGNLEVLEYLHFNTTACSTIHAMNNACRQYHRKDLAVLDFIHRHRTEGCTQLAMDMAGSPEVVKWLQVNRSLEITLDAKHAAVQRSNFEVVKYMAENSSTEFHSDSLDVASFNGNFKIFKYLFPYVKGSNKSSFILNYAAQKGDIMSMEWILNNIDGCLQQLTPNIYYYAACGGVETLEWVRKNTHVKCQDTNLIDLAGRKDNLEAIKWFHENGSLCTTEAMDNASNLSIVEFLHYNRTEGCTTKALNRAIVLKNIPVIKFLTANRTEDCSDSARNNICYDFQSRLKLIRKFKI